VPDNFATALSKICENDLFSKNIGIFIAKQVCLLTDKPYSQGDGH